jgi:hypothetical protein
MQMMLIGGSGILVVWHSLFRISVLSFVVRGLQQIAVCDARCLPLLRGHAVPVSRRRLKTGSCFGGNE